MDPVAIIGSGSQARYVVDTLELTGSQVLGLADAESAGNRGEHVGGSQVRWSMDEALGTLDPSGCRIVIAHGDNRLKHDLAHRFTNAGFSFATVIHPTAFVEGSAHIGQGCIVNANATILQSAVLGDHAVIHSGSVIEHDGHLANFVNVAPGVSFGGRVSIGTGSYVYTGATVAPNTAVGDWAVVGAGAVVIKDVPNHTTVVGNPARSINSSN